MKEHLRPSVFIVPSTLNPQVLASLQRPLHFAGDDPAAAASQIEDEAGTGVIEGSFECRFTKPAHCASPSLRVPAAAG